MSIAFYSLEVMTTHGQEQGSLTSFIGGGSVKECVDMFLDHHTHMAKPVTFQDSSRDIFIMRHLDHIPIPSYLFLSQIDHVLHCTSTLPSVIICMLFFVSILVYVYLIY